MEFSLKPKSRRPGGGWNGWKVRKARGTEERGRGMVATPTSPTVHAQASGLTARATAQAWVRTPHLLLLLHDVHPALAPDLAINRCWLTRAREGAGRCRPVRSGTLWASNSSSPKQLCKSLVRPEPIDPR
eukprot:319-Chlamydomonas_euryale.AAC.1